MTLLLLTAIEVLHLVAGAEESQKELRARYTYRETQENWRIDPYGRKIESSYRSKTFDVVWVEGRRYRKLVLRDGKPLTAEEAWRVEEDMKRPGKTDAAPLRDLATTHELTLEGNTIVAARDGKTIELTFDPATHVLVRQATRSETTSMVIDFEKVDGRVYLPKRVEVDFTVEDVHGLQVSTFSDFTAN